MRYLPAKHSCNTIGTVPCLETQRLLPCCIPHSHHKHKTRVDHGFYHAQNEAVGRNTGEVVACWRCHQNGTPAYIRQSCAAEIVQFYSLHIVVAARNFPTGSFWIASPAGYCANM